MPQYYPKFGDDVDFQLYDFNTTKKLCKKHIEVPFFKNYIGSNGQFDRCDYCGQNRKIVDLSNILRLIVVGIDYLYEDPVNSRYLNKDGEHGFDGNTMDFYDMWENIDLSIDDSDLSQEIFNHLENTNVYCLKNEFTSHEEYLGELWSHFKNTVKHKARFVFHFQKTFSNFFYDDPVEILNQVQAYIKSLNLITELPKDSRLYRCRQHNISTKIKEARDLASVPQDYAKANGRMNPAGISMFYSSKSKELTIKEVVDFSDTERPFYSTGIFYIKENLKLVDLTKIPKSPSIFDGANNHYIEIIAFLNGFIDDVTKPIDSNDSIIEYVPTQIVTEYMRFNPQLAVDGIIYPSSKDRKLNNIVLFLDHEESLEKLAFSKSSIVKTKI